MKITKYFFAAIMVFSPVIIALPKITVTFGESLDGFTRVKIKNETFIPLACYVSIDGQKSKFQLRPKSTSTWVTSTDKRYNYTNFSTWCDYLEIHPKYNLYRAY